MTRDQEKRFRKFNREAEALCRKYGFQLTGCGCCGSPYLVDPATNEQIADNLDYGDTAPAPIPYNESRKREGEKAYKEIMGHNHGE